MDRMRTLVNLLNQASQAYYNENKEIMPNIEYDRLYDELVALEKETGITLSNSPTRKVGYEVLSQLTKVTHDSPVLSLNKTKLTGELAAFLNKDFTATEETSPPVGLLSWKLDGLMVVLKYSDGVLTQAITRGNGVVGEDVTHNARWFKNIPTKINFTGALVLKGEAVISYQDFIELNETLDTENQYKNPRNLTSGTVRQLSSEIAAKRNVSYYVCSVVSAEEQDFDDKKSNALEWAASLGFDIVEYKKVTSATIEQAVKEFESRIQTNHFPSDGLVLTFDSLSYSESLGATSKFPRDSLAFKWADETAETTLLNMIWGTSRTGLINPVAEFDPVDLEGTSVNRASVHNVSVFESLALGAGDQILVYKANMIIPQIYDNLTRSSTFRPPTHCPECKAETEIIVSEGEGQNGVQAKFLYCTNPNCKAQLVRSLTHFVSRDAMNIEGFSRQTIEKFVNRGWIEDYTQIFSLGKYEAEIKKMEGFGEKSYTNLITGIEKSKSIALPNFIYALGISQVGLAGAKLLCRHYDYEISRIISADEEELITIEGFGEVIARCIHKYFNNAKNQELLNRALSFLHFQAPLPETSFSKAVLAGLTFVVTGDVHIFKNRKELSEKIESMGGKTTSSVTGKTSYLINNNATSASSKNKKAKELGIPIITEEEFIAKFPPQE